MAVRVCNLSRCIPTHVGGDDIEVIGYHVDEYQKLLVSLGVVSTFDSSKIRSAFSYLC